MFDRTSLRRTAWLLLLALALGPLGWGGAHAGARNGAHSGRQDGTPAADGPDRWLIGAVCGTGTRDEPAPGGDPAAGACVLCALCLAGAADAAPPPHRAAWNARSDLRDLSAPPRTARARVAPAWPATRSRAPPDLA